MLASVALLALSSFLSLAPQDTRVERETWPDGSVRIVREVIAKANGPVVPQGAYRAFYEGGSPRTEGEYDKGARSGTWKYWWPNGELKAEGSYSRDLPTGTWVHYHENGQKALKGRYKKGIRSGKWSVWSEDGVEDPRLTGTWEQERHEWPDGTPRMTVYRVDGVRQDVVRTYWDDGSVQVVGYYRNGQRSGKWLMHHQDGGVSRRILSGRWDADRRIEEAEPEPGSGESGELPRPPNEVCGQAPEQEERARQLDRFLASSDDEPDGRALRALGVVRDGPRSIPTVLKVLRRHGCDTPEGRRAIRLAASLVLPAMCSGHGLGAPVEQDGPEAHREILRDWTTLAAMTRDNLGFWLLEVAHGAEPASIGLPSELLRAPPLLPTDRKVGRSLRDTAAFVDRFQCGSSELRNRGGAGTRDALEAALKWLAAQQRADGSWSSDGFETLLDSNGEPGHDVGVTALALQAFLGDGHTTLEGIYSPNVIRGLSWLLGQRQPDGRILSFFGEERSPVYHGAWIYGHAMATLALSEATALSGDTLLGEATQSAADALVRARAPKSCWRYEFPSNGDVDTSVTSWAARALVAARTAGAEVDASSFTNTLDWIDEVTDPATGRCGYHKIGEPSSRHTRINDHYPTNKAEAMTGAALWVRFLLGQHPDEEPIMERHADLLKKSLPEWDLDGYGCDMYAWYMGTSAMWHFGGRHWDAWNKAMKEAVLDSQRKDGPYAGSWDPVGPWGYSGGRLYSTALMAMCLEVYTRDPRIEPGDD